MPISKNSRRKRTWHQKITAAACLKGRDGTGVYMNKYSPGLVKLQGRVGGLEEAEYSLRRCRRLSLRKIEIWVHFNIARLWVVTAFNQAAREGILNEPRAKALFLGARCCTQAGKALVNYRLHDAHGLCLDRFGGHSLIVGGLYGNKPKLVGLRLGGLIWRAKRRAVSTC